MMAAKEARKPKSYRASRPTDDEIRKLLQLAGAASSDKGAMSWLREALVAAQSFNRAAQQRPLSASHNSILTNVSMTARELSGLLRRLHSQPHTWGAFWRSFEPARPFDRRAVAEDAELHRVFSAALRPPIGEREIMQTLTNIERAGLAAKDKRQGRPREAGTQHVVDLALQTFVRFSPHQPSGTSTGAFAGFARAFYKTATGLEPDGGGLDRQIREAVNRLPTGRRRSRSRQPARSS